jgi:hypothetical protein
MGCKVQLAPNKWQQSERFSTPALLQNVRCTKRYIFQLLR